MENKTYGKIVLIGDVGKGKTALCNTLLGKEVGKVASLECAGGVTERLTGYDGRWRADGPQLTVFDMPGFGDTKVLITDLLNFWRKEIQSKKFTAVCFVVRLDDHRLTSYQQAALKILETCSENSQPWGSIIIVGTHADKLDKDDDPADKKLKFILEEINKMIGQGEAVQRAVGISLKKNQPLLLEDGLKQLEGHILDLLGKELKMKEKFPENKQISTTVISNTYLKDQGGWLSKLGLMYCFDGDMTVRLLKEDKVISSKLSEVQLFDMIQVNDGSFEPVMILSRHINAQIPMMEFEIEDQETQKKMQLRLVEGHFMFVMREKMLVHIPARDVTMNDKLIHFSGNSTVYLSIINITRKFCKDAINVRTRSRTVIVNNFYCSSVVEGDAGAVGHWIAMASGKIHKTLPNEMNKFVVMLKSAYLRARNGKI